MFEKFVAHMSPIISTITMTGTSKKLAFSSPPKPFLMIKKQKNNITPKTKNLIKAGRGDNNSVQPAIMADDKIVHMRKLITFENFEFFNFSSALSPFFKKKLKRSQNKKNAITMHGKENTPKREKKTTISFPLIKPEPITVPIITSIAEKTFICFILLTRKTKKK